jgi:uncharacterized protein DUF6918
MATLEAILLNPENKPHVIDDCLTLIDQEVKGKSGVSGTAVKLAYKTANAFASGYLRGMVELLAPDMIIELEPFWADFTASGAGVFGDYLVKHGDEVSEALLSVTDRRAETSTRPTILKAYKTVRGGASKHVTAALPALGALVQKYAG